VVTWACRVGLVSPAEARTLRAAAAADARASTRAFTRALALRESLTDVFVPVARGSSPQREALRAVGELVSGALAHGELRPSGPIFTWQWRQGAELEAPLWPVAFAAGSLLGSPRLARLKGCPACSFVFVDESKNGSRRWCSMEDCGRAAKIRSYVERRADRRRAATSLQP
jgi:predicted RNA-binding Zn ribbon-like protein